MPTNVRDPRTIITPDAFEISADLLGTPLARPWPRFWAMMIDLAVVGVLTAMFDDIALFVWGLVALVLVRVAFKRGSRGPSEAVSLMMRTATGCLGLTILMGVVVAFLVMRFSDGGSGGPDIPGVTVRAGEDGREMSGEEAVQAALATVRGGRALRAAATPEEAEAAALVVLRGMPRLGMTDEDLVEMLEGLTPGDAAWERDDEDIYRRAVERWHEGEAGEAAPGAAGDTTVTDIGAPGVDSLTGPQVLEAYGRLLTAGGPDTAGPRARALRRRAAALVATDTLSGLQARLDSAEEATRLERRRRERAEAELESGGNAFAELVRDIWDQLGSAIGLWSIYFTVLLTLWNGQTLGKRLLGLRVLRLDGEPMNWWSAFERAGGYVAGLATGLLGFAQVFWDANRQCIHDKIVGTVVVDDRAARVPGAWEEAWKAAPEEEAR